MTALAKEIDRDYRFEYVRLTDLKIDPSYHVPERFREARAEVIAAHFDEDKAGVITCSFRGGVMWLIDGNHRRFAAISVGLTHLFAKVFLDKTQRDEASIYLGLSDAVRLSEMDKWDARRVEGDPIVAAIETILRDHGIRVVRGGKTHHTTKALSTITKIYSGGLLDDVLDLLMDVWPEQQRAYDALVLQGVASFLFCYRRTLPRVDEKRLRERLGMVTPEAIIRASKEFSTSGGRFNTGRAASAADGLLAWGPPRTSVLSLYNHGLRTKLPPLGLRELRAILDGEIVALVRA